MDEDVEQARGGGAGKGGGSARGDSRRSRLKPAPDPRLSRSLEYGVAILESFSDERRLLGIADIAKLIGISRSTTHRYAITLVELGFLEQDDKRKYRLSARAAGPGLAAIGAIRREVHARGVLEELRDQTGHTVSMGVLDGVWVVYVHRLCAHRAGQYEADGDLGVGAHVPVHASALGRVLLAGLSDADRRELLARVELNPPGRRGRAKRERLLEELEHLSPREVLLCADELRAGVRRLAALVPRSSGERPVAIDVTIPTDSRTDAQLIAELGPALQRAAKLIGGE